LLDDSIMHSRIEEGLIAADHRESYAFLSHQQGLRRVYLKG
jgi:hypothetical protein